MKTVYSDFFLTQYFIIFNPMLFSYTTEKKPKKTERFSDVLMDVHKEIEYRLKLINNHWMLAAVINKQS